MAKKALGRGLSAIIEDVEESYNKDLEHSRNTHLIQDLDVELIKPNPYQPRTHFDKSALKELSASIKKHGLLQPIIVYEKDDEYILLAGERRLRATKLAKIKTIKAIIADITSQNLRELALIENIQREDLNPIELAISYKELINEYKVTQEELSKIIHKSRAQITNTMRLLNLGEFTRNLIVEGKLSQGHAKVIVGLEKDDEKMVVDTILGQKLSVRQAEDLVKKMRNSQDKPLQTKKEVEPFESLQDAKDILKQMGINAKLQKKSLVLQFKNEKQVEEFIKKINK
ncbi:MAG: chromosome partitioning protein ParB [Proteobacteria bacterium]|nr:MAG: chromosome partitioning protein ParB [Pseudomonadota bacterium]